MDDILLHQSPLSAEVLVRAARVRLVIFDVDGVLTDGGLFLGDDGQEYKAFNSKDGHGMKMLQATGVEIGIITGRTSQVVGLRMNSLGVRHVYQGQHDKRPAFAALLRDLGLTAEETAYVGDDVVDLPTMLRAGLAVAVADAHPMARAHAHLVTDLGGGRGAAREVCEIIMHAQGTLAAAAQRYLEP